MNKDNVTTVMAREKYCVAIRIKALTEMNYTHTVMVML